MTPSHDDHPHVPGPSLWPVGFAIGVVVLLVGLIISWIVTGLGALIALVFAFLWIRDLTAGSHLTETPEVEPETAATAPVAAPPADAVSYKTEDRFPRSKFLELSTLGVGGLIGGIVTAPALGFMIGPAFLKTAALSFAGGLLPGRGLVNDGRSLARLSITKSDRFNIDNRCRFV